jgi:uncharacterized protein YndB with AHSA1/START domain
MSNDIESLAATDRSVSLADELGPLGRRTVITRTYQTSVDDLWDALTNAERIPRWFLPISGDLREGGRYQLEGNAGGVVEQCDPPHRFRVTWEYGPGATTWLTVILATDGPGTRLRIEHVGQIPEELWAQFGPGATGIGWDLALHGLALHIDTHSSRDATAAEAWMTSPDGVAFIEGSNTAWMNAAITAGAPIDEAEAQAQRTLAVYTGQTEPPNGD